MTPSGKAPATMFSVAAAGICMASTAGISQPRAGGLYIIEAVNASFASAQEVTLNEISPATAYMVGYPYRDAGVLDTAALIQDPTFSPQGVWLAGPVGTLFGTGINATAVLLLVNVRTSSLPSLRTHPCKCTGIPAIPLCAAGVGQDTSHAEHAKLIGRVPDMHAGNGREYMLPISGWASMCRALCPTIEQAETIILKVTAAHKIQTPAAACSKLSLDCWIEIDARQIRRICSPAGHHAEELTGLLSCGQGAPVYDFMNATLTLNITVITDPTALKFQDGIARQTYQNSVTPNQFARVRPSSSAAGMLGGCAYMSATSAAAACNCASPAQCEHVAFHTCEVTHAYRDGIP